MIIQIKDVILENIGQALHTIPDFEEVNTFDEEKTQPIVDRAYEDAQKYIDDAPNGEEINAAIAQGNSNMVASTDNPEYLSKKGFFSNEDPLETARRVQGIEANKAVIGADSANAHRENLITQNQEILQDRKEKAEFEKNAIDKARNPKLIDNPYFTGAAGLGIGFGAKHLYDKLKK